MDLMEDVDTAFDLTRKRVTEGSELPMVMVKGTERVVIGLACRDAEERAKVLFGMGVMLSNLKPEYVIFSAIAWCSKQFLKRPSEASDKEEVVLVGWQTRDGSGGSRALPFARVGKEFVWGEVMEVEDFESPPLGAFWDGVRLGELKPELAEEWRQRVGIKRVNKE
ncbi:MAG TPA: hypothetical protein G4O03_00715 [Dehalococcoidia bacterium]|nr:hypothetical protein [Dehalococcoidia bacterium]